MVALTVNLDGHSMVCWVGSLSCLMPAALEAALRFRCPPSLASYQQGKDRAKPAIKFQLSFQIMIIEVVAFPSRRSQYYPWS